ncbi:MAG TPA: universal stress protein [Pyrinomonadaceae bacterium]|jgi:nucleotide-binding universal stress UspA family protein|nr:universal stress protein [Pyrinomonadaceae bacterium]
MKILLAVDSSEYSAAAIKEVAKRPWPARSTVRVLSVVEPYPAIAVEPWYGGRESLETLDREMQRRASNLTKKTAEHLKRKELKVEAVIRTGHPATVIVDEAREWSADLVVLGSHGYTGIKRLFLGSVALSVVGHAPCSVEVVRLKQPKKR